MGAAILPPATHVQQPLTTLQLDWRPEEMVTRLDRATAVLLVVRSAQRPGCVPFSLRSPRRGFAAGQGESGARHAHRHTTRGTVVEDACKEIADLCVHCHMCRLECPAQVDIPKLMIEAKAAYVATNGEALLDWFSHAVDRLCASLRGFPGWRIGLLPIGSALGDRKTMGIAQGRKLPRFSSRPSLQQATQRR